MIDRMLRHHGLEKEGALEAAAGWFLRPAIAETFEPHLGYVAAAARLCEDGH
jgi:hypothetical protein